ncbi:MAG: O-antigen polysaccharide polymerase Wzy [Acidobacteriota bacterium]
MVRKFTVHLYYFGMLLAILGALGQSKELMAVGALAAAFGYGLRDYFSARPDSITPMTINALFLGVWMGLGHLIACFVVGTQYEETFYGYSVMDFLLEAQYLATLTVLVPLVSYRWFTRLNVGPRRLLLRVPTVAFEVSGGTLLIFCLAMFVFDWTSKLINIPLESLGVLAAFMSRSSEIAIFLLAWHWLGPSPTLPKWTRWVLYLGMAFDVGYSTMFSYMRGEIAYPLFTFFLAFLLRKAVSKRIVAIACVVIFVFASIYKVIGDTRGQGIRGSERIAIIIEQYLSNGSDVNQAREEEGGDSALMSLIARGCNFGQLSQVVHIADEEGYYDGKTLEYLSYAFIPRLIWPEKPLITPGQWFAEKIGHGTRLSETKFSNSINMSVAGEFYLNFGWIGAVSGLILMGFLYAIFWESADFYGKRNNPTGQGLGIAILLQAIGGTSAGALLHLIFLYLGMLAISRVLIIFASRKRAIRTPNIRPVVRSGITGG